MAAIVNTGLTTRGLRREFFDHYSQWTLKTPNLWQKLCTTIASDGNSETYKWLGSHPMPRSWGTGRVERGMNVGSFTVTNDEYELTLSVDRKELEDDQTGQIKLKVASMAASVARHNDYLLSQLIENGGTAGYLSYDGQVFFSAAHTEGDSGTQDNDVTTPAATGTTATTAEMRTAIGLMIEAMAGFKDDQGIVHPFLESGLVLVVPPVQWTAAREAVQSSTILGTDNKIATMDVVMLSSLSTAANVYLFKTDDVINPFILQQRTPLEFSAFEGNSEESFRTNKFMFGTRERKVMIYGAWRNACRCAFS